MGGVRAWCGCLGPWAWVWAGWLSGWLGVARAFGQVWLLQPPSIRERPVLVGARTGQPPGHDLLSGGPVGSGWAVSLTAPVIRDLGLESWPDWFLPDQRLPDRPATDPDSSDHRPIFDLWVGGWCRGTRTGRPRRHDLRSVGSPGGLARTGPAPLVRLSIREPVGWFGQAWPLWLAFDP